MSENKSNLTTNSWALLGSLTLIIGGIGHFVLVDMCALFLEADFVNWLPYSLINQLKESTIDFGILGNNNAFRIFSGFSLWMAFSLIIIGLFDLMIFSHLTFGHPLRKNIILISLIAAVIFFILAATSFIYPAAIGGAVATVFFAIALMKEKRKLKIIK